MFHLNNTSQKNYFSWTTVHRLLTFSATRTWALPAYLLPNFPTRPPEPPSSGARRRVALLGSALGRRRHLLVVTAVLNLTVLLFLLRVLLVEDSRGQQPLQDALVHPQLGSDLPLSGDGCGVSAQRADDRRVRSQTRLTGPLGSRQGQQAALAEAVFALELPGTPPTSVKGPVTNSTLELWIHAAVWSVALLADLSQGLNEVRWGELSGLIPGCEEVCGRRRETRKRSRAGPNKHNLWVIKLKIRVTQPKAKGPAHTLPHVSPQGHTCHFTGQEHSQVQPDARQHGVLINH